MPQNDHAHEDSSHKDFQDAAKIASTLARDSDSASLESLCISIVTIAFGSSSDEEDEFEDARSTLSCATHSAGWGTISDDGTSTSSGTVDADH